MDTASSETPRLARVVDKVAMPNTQLVEPDPKDVILCTYPNTLDGILAAWVVRGVAKRHQLPVEFRSSGVSRSEYDAGRHWLAICDTVSSIPGDTTTAKSAISFFSMDGDGVSPLPFQLWQRKFPYGVVHMTRGDLGKTARVHDGSRCLAALVWDFFHADRVGFDPRPRAINYVNDAGKKSPEYKDSAAVVACLESYPRDFQTIDRLVEACDDRKRLSYVVTGGQAILRYKENQEIA